jgi:uncharacterized membrane protein
MKPDAFVGSLDDERIVAAIREAEARSRGEIRVHVAEREVADPRGEAAAVFERLGMADTAERNGVLVFVAPESQSIRDEFRAGRYTEGLVAGVRAVGEELARHFPRRPGETDRNELPDTVSRS